MNYLKNIKSKTNGDNICVKRLYQKGGGQVDIKLIDEILRDIGLEHIEDEPEQE